MRGLIFDFDGVIADSEALANAVLAETVTGLGREITLQDALDRYMGRRWPEVVALIEADIGRPVPERFSDALKAATLERFRSDLREVQGARAFIQRFSWLPRCIASSTSLDRLRVCLEVLGLSQQFGENVFSAEMVERGKPHPDIFLRAAEGIEVSPRHCIVIEDSASGVRAGVAAGMIVVGLCAGSHLKVGHDRNLAEAGATFVAADWGEVGAFVSTLTEAVAGLGI